MDMGKLRWLRAVFIVSLHLFMFDTMNLSFDGCNLQRIFEDEFLTPINVS